MKAFEKWLKEPTCDNRYDRAVEDRAAMEGWRAALEWALTQTDTGEIDLFPVINPRWLRYELENRTPPSAKAFRNLLKLPDTKLRKSLLKH